LVEKITKEEYKAAVKDYRYQAGLKTERDRMSDVKTISGQFTGAYAIHPLSGDKIPIWIGDYVLASYGTGAVMAVPCGDGRDYNFAKHFEIPIRNIFEGIEDDQLPYEEKSGKIANSDFLNGLEISQAIKKAIEVLEER